MDCQIRKAEIAYNSGEQKARSKAEFDATVSERADELYESFKESLPPELPEWLWINGLDGLIYDELAEGMNPQELGMRFYDILTETLNELAVKKAEEIEEAK